MAVTQLTATNIGLYLGGVLVACSTSASLSISREYLDAVCAGSGDWSEKTPGRMSWSGSLDALWRVADATDEATNVTLRDLFTNMTAGTAMAIKFGVKDGLTPAVAYQFTGNAFISGLNPSSSVDDVPTWTADFEGTGPLTLVDNAA